MLRVTPIYGSSRSNGNTTASQTPSCTLVEYGGVRVLCNVGWDGSCSGAESFPNPLPPHDVLIVTDSTLGAMGGLPIYHLHNPNHKMYATFPTVKMGQMTLYDFHACTSLDGACPPYSLDDIDAACSSLQTIKYSQSVFVHDRVNKPALSITAHRSGHVVGGAFIVLKRLLDETIVVVTHTYHVAKELHLDSATLLKHGSTPDVLITRPGGPPMPTLAQLYSSSGSKKKSILPLPLVSQSHKALVETVLAVLRRDGNVLLPVDASGRVLELMLLLSQHWDKHRLSATYNLCWLGPMVSNVLEYARSQLEWLAAPLGAMFDSQRGHPFALQNVHFCTSVAELDAVLQETNSNPTVVLASGASLDHGPARDVLLKWADNPDHAIVLTDSSQCIARSLSFVTTAPATSTTESGAAATTATTTAAASTTIAATTVKGQTTEGEQQDDNEESGALAILPPSQVSKYCTAAQLLLQWCQAKRQGREMDDVVAVDVLVPHRAPLAGPALKHFLAQEEAARLAKQKLQEERAMMLEVELAKGRLRLDQEDVVEKKASKSTSPKKQMTAIRPKKKSRFDSSLFLKFSKPLHLTFEVVEEAVGIGQSDSTAKYGIGESVGRSGEVLEDDYGIAVIPERFVDIVTGVDPSKFASGSGRIGDEVMRRGFGFGVDGSLVLPNSSKKRSSIVGPSVDGEEDLEEEMDEQALEAADLSEGTGIVRGRNGRPPIKVSTLPRRLEVLAEVAYVPLEGRVDARSARQSVRALQPRQVVILGGIDNDGEGDESWSNEVANLAEAVRSFAISGGDKSQDAATNVMTPSNGETVELNVGHAAYGVRLLDTPYMTPEEKEAARAAAEAEDESYVPPEPIEPFEAKLGECTVSLLDSVATGQKVALDGSVVLAPRSAASKKGAKRPGSLYLSSGDVLLTDLRAEVIAQGMKAVYSAHAGYSQLVVNGKIIVKKDQESGRIDVEGPLCEDFYTVRSVVCGQYVTL